MSDVPRSMASVQGRPFLACQVDLLGPTFLVLNGDTYLDTDYGRLIRAHRERPAALILSLVNVGVYVGSATVVDYFPTQRPLSLERMVFPGLVEGRLLRGVVVPGEVIDIGMPVSYQQFLAEHPDGV